MEDYEQDFVLRMKGLVHAGPDFANLVKDALLETMGEAGSSVLLVGMDKATLEQPARFARELMRFFGAGSASVLKVVVTRASGSRRTAVERSSSGTLGVVLDEGEGPEARLGVGPIRQAYLHDHRMKDELDEYRERIAVSESDSR